MVLVAIISSFLFFSQVSASEEVYTIFAVDCGETATLLDFKELYDVDSNYTFDLEGLNEDEVMNSYFLRMKKLDEGRSIVLRNIYRKISNKTRFVENVNLGVHTDEIGFSRWRGCEIKSIAKGKDFATSGKTLIIKKELWDKLDYRSKAGLYFNYLLNIDYIFNRFHENTLNSRYFNALIASDRFMSIPRTYYPYIYESIIDFREVSFYGLFFEVRSYIGSNGRDYSIRFDANDDLIYGVLTSNSYAFQTNKFLVQPNFDNAPYMKGRFGYSGRFRLDENTEFTLEGFTPFKKHNCLGNFKLTGKRGMDLTLIKKEKSFFIKEAKGEFIFKNKIYTRIQFNADKFEIDESSFKPDYNSYSNLRVSECE